jgi:hypothetical protein
LQCRHVIDGVVELADSWPLVETCHSITSRMWFHGLRYNTAPRCRRCIAAAAAAVSSVLVILE